MGLHGYDGVDSFGTIVADFRYVRLWELYGMEIPV